LPLGKALGVTVKSNNADKLKIKYGMFGLFFVWFCIAVAAYPLWLFSQWLSVITSINPDLPILEQENGKIWLTLFSLSIAVIFGAVYSFLALLFCSAKGYSKAQYLGIFFKNKYPTWWYK
jgi:hypothetical protein